VKNLEFMLRRVDLVSFKCLVKWQRKKEKAGGRKRRKERKSKKENLVCFFSFCFFLF